MTTKDLKEIVTDHQVFFSHYRKGIMYYAIILGSCATTYEFQVPLDDIGDATLEGEDKAIYFMRWIRKALEDGTFVKSNNKKFPQSGLIQSCES